MRGPGYRLDLDVRRVWRCPQCGKERRLGGEVTAVSCICGQSMHLIEERKSHARSTQSLVSRELTVASFALTEEELSRPLPARPPREATADANDTAGSESHGRTSPHPRPRPRHGAEAHEPEERSSDIPPVAEPAPIEPSLVDSPSEIPSDDAFGAGLDDAASVG